MPQASSTINGDIDGLTEKKVVPGFGCGNGALLPPTTNRALDTSLSFLVVTTTFLLGFGVGLVFCHADPNDILPVAQEPRPFVPSASIVGEPAIDGTPSDLTNATMSEPVPCRPQPEGPGSSPSNPCP